MLVFPAPSFSEIRISVSSFVLLLETFCHEGNIVNVHVKKIVRSLRVKKMEFLTRGCLQAAEKNSFATGESLTILLVSTLKC